MLIIPIHTGILSTGDDLSSAIMEEQNLQPNDIVVVSSKAVAVCEGNILNLNSIEIEDSTKKWAKKHGRDEAMYQAILNETKRLNGKIINNDHRAVLTELKPSGFLQGTIMAASAGLDKSNIEKGKAIGWPLDPVTSVKKLKTDLIKKCKEKFMWEKNDTLGIILTDSSLRPRRLGVVAQALVVSGFDPIVSQIGKPDIYGNPLTVTHEAIADQLATAANFIMSNANQRIPAVIIRDHGIKFSEYEGWVPGIDIEDDLFHGLL